MNLMRARLINEEQIRGSVWRSTDQNWLKIFLDQDMIIKTKEPGKFISLSFDSESGGMDSFGGKEIVIEFDEDKVFNQGAEEVFYEPEWFESRPKESLYITGYRGERDYYDQIGFEDAEDANNNLEFSWENTIEDYEHEREILLKELKYEPGLIKRVYFYEEPDPILLSMLEENNIPYSIKKTN